MSRPELKFELDEYGRIVYRVTDEGVLLSKDEKEFIIDHVTRMQAENAKLRELVRDVYTLHWNGLDCTECPWFDECDTTGGCPWLGIFADHMRELGVKV